MNILYTASATSTGGREGQSATEDGSFKFKLSTPKELGGAGGEGTNPEQLFASGYSACFLSAIKYAANQDKQKIPDNSTVTAVVGVGPVPTGFALDVELRVALPGVDQQVAESLVKKAHTVCPYSHSISKTVDVRLVVNNNKVSA